MKLIINASLKQVNLVWSTVSVLKADALATYPGNHGHLLLSLALQGPYTVLGWWCRSPVWIQDGRCTSHLYQSLPHAIHLHPTFMDQRVPSITFFPPPSSLLTRKSQVSTVISALNLKLRLSLNHFLSNEANLSHFKVTANTWIYSFYSIPLDIPILHIISAFQYLAINRYVKTWSSLQGTAVKFRETTVRWNPEQSGAEELSLRSQGLIRLLQPNLAPLMNKLRWFSPHLSHLCFAGTSGTPAQ